MKDPVNNPAHYTAHPSGVDCIQITEHMSFNLGNAIKYIWRADLKGKPTEDLYKSIWYIQREINRRMQCQQSTNKNATTTTGRGVSRVKAALPENGLAPLNNPNIFQDAPTQEQS
jgi:hypothetical protein